MTVCAILGWAVGGGEGGVCAIIIGRITRNELRIRKLFDVSSLRSFVVSLGKVNDTLHRKSPSHRDLFFLRS